MQNIFLGIGTCVQAKTGLTCQEAREGEYSYQLPQEEETVEEEEEGISGPISDGILDVGSSGGTYHLEAKSTVVLAGEMIWINEGHGEDISDETRIPLYEISYNILGEHSSCIPENVRLFYYDGENTIQLLSDDDFLLRFDLYQSLYVENNGTKVLVQLLADVSHCREGSEVHIRTENLRYWHAGNDVVEINTERVYLID